MAGLFDPSMFGGLPISGLLSALAGIQGPGGQGPMWGGNVGMSAQGNRAYSMAGGDPGPSALDPPNIPLPMADPRTAMASGGGMIAPPPPMQPDPQAQPMGPAAAMQGAAGPMQGPQQPDLLSRLGSGLSGAYMAAPMLMQAGGAMMRGGLGAGLEAMGTGTQALQQRQLQLAQMAMTYQALKARGLSDSDARLILLNPEAMKAYSGNLGPDSFSTSEMTDASGNKVPVTTSSRTGQLRQNPISVMPRAPTPQEVAILRANPGMQGEFDRKFGQGAAQRAMLGQ